MMNCSIPGETASSTAYWMIGLSTSGSISFGCALVAGRNRVPQPAAGNTAFRTRIEPHERDGGGCPRISPGSLGSDRQALAERGHGRRELGRPVEIREVGRTQAEPLHLRQPLQEP